MKFENPLTMFGSFVCVGALALCIIIGYYAGLLVMRFF